MSASRLDALRTVVRQYSSALVGYSGGVDSSVVAVVVRQELGKDDMLAVIGRSASLAGEQAGAAHRIASLFDVPTLELETNELDDTRYLANPINRCFFCKTELWSKLGELARVRGLAVVCDGTNAADLDEHRPGLLAGARAGVRSPLAEAGLSKTDVRAAAHALGLPNWDAPAAPCLSSRVQYGVEITPARLRQVEEAEAFLRELGVRGDLRVRHHGGWARLEVERAWIPWVLARQREVSRRLQALGFERVEVDPRGYRRGGLLADRTTGR